MVEGLRVWLRGWRELLRSGFEVWGLGGFEFVVWSRGWREMLFSGFEVWDWGLGPRVEG